MSIPYPIRIDGVDCLIHEPCGSGFLEVAGHGGNYVVYGPETEVLPGIVQCPSYEVIVDTCWLKTLAERGYEFKTELEEWPYGTRVGIVGVRPEGNVLR